MMVQFYTLKGEPYQSAFRIEALVPPALIQDSSGRFFVRARPRVIGGTTTEIYNEAEPYKLDGGE